MFEIGNNEKYEINIIENSITYIKKSAIQYLFKFYYLILYKSYLKEKKHFGDCIGNLTSSKFHYCLPQKQF